MDIVQTFLNFALLGSAWVLWVLLFLSIVSVALILEKSWTFFVEKKRAQQFYDRLRQTLLDADQNLKFERNLQSLGEEPLMEARMLKVAAQDARHPDHGSLDAFFLEEKAKMEKGLVFLATLGNNAPFVGLFGTVLGIIAAFHSLGKNTEDAQLAVMSGISEALVATAVGLLVALPAVAAYNFFSRTIKKRTILASSYVQKVREVMATHSRDHS